MIKINNYEELKNLNSELKEAAEKINKNKVMIQVAMATCSIASGSAEVIEFFREEMPKQPVEFIIKSTGCMGLCHSEPTVEVKLPDSDPVIFGKVDKKRAKTIIEEYIKNGKMVDGVIEGN